MSVITHNMAADFANRQLNITGDKKAKASEKLATGFRINRAADDAAGLSISEKLRWQARGLDKGSTNAQDGSSLLQVADGALAEVHEMLQRVNELAVQAANDTNTAQDRAAIQEEINQILVAIDDIGENTEYNTLKIFQGGIEQVIGPDGNPINVSDIPISDLQLANTALQDDPFFENSPANYLGLSVSTVDGYTPTSWNLIFGNGSTSHSTVKYSYADASQNTVTKYLNLDNMAVSNFSYNGTDTYSRVFSYADADGVGVEIEQTIKVGQNDGESQYYEMSYMLKNTGTESATIDFMFNADTAYNNNDRCEGYFIGGQKVDNFCVYTDDTKTDYEQQNAAYVHDISGIGEGFSIIDEDNALSFSEKVTWDAGNGPDTVSIGNWGSDTGDWAYYDNLSSMLGGSTNDSDIAFSLMWNDTQLASGGWTTYSFKYGICDATKDVNTKDVPMTFAQTTGVKTDTLNLWIQSGATNGSGMFISIGEMSTGSLGLRGIDVGSFDDASDAIVKVNAAIEKISKQRSSMGAQQNRLDYTIRLDDNTSENTQAAESRLRDTDMAAEMVELSKHGILEQAGQSMLAQANQSPQRVLSLLQQ